MKQSRNSFPYFEPGQIMLMSLREVKQIGGGTVWRESDDFEGRIQLNVVGSMT